MCVPKKDDVGKKFIMIYFYVSEKLRTMLQPLQIGQFVARFQSNDDDDYDFLGTPLYISLHIK